MTTRTVNYLKQDKARKIMEKPLANDLKTFLNATLALAKSTVVKHHVNNTLHQLNTQYYKLSA